MSWQEKLLILTTETARQGAAKLTRNVPADGHLGKLLRKIAAEEVTLPPEGSRNGPPAAPPPDGSPLVASAEREAPGDGRGIERAHLDAAGLSPRRGGEAALSPAARFAWQSNGGSAAAIAVQPYVVPRDGLSEPEYSLGDLIDGAYEVTGILASGRQFTVYRARHRSWDAAVAVKVPREELLKDAAALQAIVNEVPRWTALGLHPHVAYCHHVHVAGGVPLIVLEDFDGGNLRPWIADGRCANLRQGLNLAIQICHGLEHAHAAGLCHGALRPENVLLTSAGLAAVSDFAIARRAAAEAAVPGSRAGAAAGRSVEHGPETYVAPERWIGSEPPAPAGDVFALGVCLYEMFCGFAPYEMARGPRREAPEPRAPQGGAPLPERLAALLKRCVDWDAERRPRGVAEIRRELCAVHLEGLGRPSPFAELPDATWEPDGCNNRAVSALLFGRQADADAAWESALSVDPRHLATTYNYGITRWSRGDLTDEALVERLSAIRSCSGRDVSASYLLALVHLDRGDPASAVALLEQAEARRPRLPEIEHALDLARSRLSGEAGPRELCGHRAFVSAVSLSEDGRFVLSASDDCTLRLWETHTGRTLRSFEGHAKRVGAVALDAAGETAISGGDDFALRFWDVRSGQCADTVSLAGNVFSVAISGDGSRAVSASGASDNFVGVDNTEVQVWDMQKRRLRARLEGHGNATKSVAITADGRWAVTGSDDLTVRVWDASTGACRRVLQGHDHYVSCVSVRPDGKVALSGSWDKTLRLWDTSTGCCLRVFKAGSAIVTAVYLSADGRLAISGGWDGTVRLWEVETGRCLRTFAGHGSLVTGVALSADGRTAVSGSWDRMVRVWSVPQAAERLCSPRLSVKVPYARLPAAEPEADELVAEADRAWREGRIAEALATARRARDKGGDEGAETRRLWRDLSRSCRRVGLRGARQEPPFAAPDRARSARLSADGTWAILACRDGRLRIWDMDLERCSRVLEGHADRVLDVRLSADETRALSAGADGTLRLWDLKSGECRRIFAGHRGVVSAASVTPAWDRVLSASYDHTLRLWDLESGECLRLFKGHARQVCAVAASADGASAVSGARDGTVCLWDVASGVCTRVLDGHRAGVASVAIAADGKLAASADGAGVIRLWETATGACARLLEGHAGGIAAIALSGDGRWLVSAGDDGTVRLWDTGAATPPSVLCRSAIGFLSCAFDAEGSSIIAAEANGRSHVIALDWELAVEAPLPG